MKVKAILTNIKAVLYSRYCKANPAPVGRRQISFSEFCADHLPYLYEMKPLLPERKLLFQYFREVWGLKVYPAGGVSFDDGWVSYWSNAAGDLFDANAPFDPKDIRVITEKELPEALRWAYQNLWSEGYSGLCYLVHTPDAGYGVALAYEFPSAVAYDGEVMEDAEADALFDALLNIAGAIKEVFGYEVLLAERSGVGYDECHQMMVVLPAAPNLIREEDVRVLDCAVDTVLGFMKAASTSRISESHPLGIVPLLTAIRNGGFVV